MPQVMVRYKVKPDRVAENEQLIRAVYEELHHTAPAGLRYATFRLDDGLTFVHVAMMDGGNPLAEVQAFQRFKRNLAARCDEQPVRTELDEIGSFRVFA
jgi:hypothetical protein